LAETTIARGSINMCEHECKKTRILVDPSTLKQINALDSHGSTLNPIRVRIRAHGPPLFQSWASEGDAIATSLLPKVVSELCKRFRRAAEQYGAGPSQPQPPPQAPTPSASAVGYLSSTATLLYPNLDFQAGMVLSVDRQSTAMLALRLAALRMVRAPYMHFQCSNIDTCNAFISRLPEPPYPLAPRSPCCFCRWRTNCSGSSRNCFLRSAPLRSTIAPPGPPQPPKHHQTATTIMAATEEMTKTKGPAAAAAAAAVRRSGPRTHSSAPKPTPAVSAATAPRPTPAWGPWTL